MLLADYAPHSALVAKATEVARPRLAAIDAHQHLQHGPEGGWIQHPLAELLAVLDEAGVQAVIDLDGGRGEDVLHRHLDYFKSAAPERFHVFAGVDWAAWPAQGDRFGEWAAARLRAQAARGAEGLKIFKALGLQVRDQHGALVAVDDPRLDPLWAAAGELGLPVLIHAADPVAFFWPLDGRNERWEELRNHPNWHVPSPPGPAFASIVAALANLVARHPGTTFIAAHVGGNAEDLAWVGALLDRCPNLYVDIGARIAELGRQPYSARRFFLRYADRILFATDHAAEAAWYRLHYRFLETDDEYFDYGTGPRPRQGRWRIYGLSLPDDVLEQVYYRNAARILGVGTR